MVIPKALHPLNILIAFDGSTESRAGINLVQSLRLPPYSSVTLLTVIDHLSNAEKPSPESYLEAQYSMESLGATITTEILEGIPAEQIAQFGRQYQFDLIVIGAKGKGGVLDALLGSVAQQVIEKADHPIWVVRLPGGPLRNIILTTDGTQPGLQVAQYMGLFPFPKDCQLTVLHVLPPLPQPALAGPFQHDAVPPNRGALLEFDPHSDFVHLREIQERSGQEIIKSTLRALYHTLFGRSSSVMVTSALREGDPTSEILHFAQEIHSDLIVCGSRGLSQVRGWLMHSVSRKLILHAPCSVLAVRGLIASGEPGWN